GLVSARTGEVIATLNHALHAAFSPNGKLVATIGNHLDATGLHLVDCATGKELAGSPRIAGPLTAFAWSPDADRMLVARPDGSLQLVDISSGQVMTEFT